MRGGARKKEIVLAVILVVACVLGVVGHRLYRSYESDQIVQQAEEREQEIEDGTVGMGVPVSFVRGPGDDFTGEFIITANEATLYSSVADSPLAGMEGVDESLFADDMTGENDFDLLLCDLTVKNVSAKASTEFGDEENEFTPDSVIGLEQSTEIVYTSVPRESGHGHFYLSIGEEYPMTVAYAVSHRDADPSNLSISGTFHTEGGKGYRIALDVEDTRDGGGQ